MISKNNSASELKQAAEGGSEGKSGKIEEEFTVARLYVSKMKSEVKNLVHKATLLEASQADGVAKNEAMEKDLSEARLLVGQHEAKMKSMNEAIKVSAIAQAFFARTSSYSYSPHFLEN